MFPTSHDISMDNVWPCIETLRRLIDAGNDILIVSKPDPKCIKLLCEQFENEKAPILFRFTIGSANENTLKFWEPGAPSFNERLSALRHAYEQGFQTSISCEPMLDNEIGKVIEAVLPYVTDAVWLGRANNLRQNLALNCPDNAEVMAMADRLLAEQTDEYLRELHRRYCSNPKIKFKDSIKIAVGLELLTEAGLDV